MDASLAMFVAAMVGAVMAYLWGGMRKEALRIGDADLAELFAVIAFLWVCFGGAFMVGAFYALPK